MDKFSYAIGMAIAANLKSMGAESISVEDFSNGLASELRGEKTEMTQQEAQMEVQNHFAQLQAKAMEENMKKGQEFLEENKKREGVVTLPSGLQYEVLKEGNGKKPGATDQVKCHYEGTLIDGTVFDSSVKRGEPATFGVNQVIKGWVEALQLMSEGSKWRLFIPQELAYGSQQVGEVIAPCSTLVFDVELIEIV